MTRKFACRSVPSTWLEHNGRRLDCGPYMSGGIEAREILKRLSVRKNLLKELTKDGIGGIVNAGRIARIWVDDLEHGYPFLSSTDILQADLSTLSYIAKSVVKQNRQLLIKKNWTLITRSGSIGRMAYARSDMDGMACTEDVLRVIPDEDKVLPGYIYAYLGTKFGVPLVASSTYGSIITHLEPNHIADLPVPRLGEVEEQAHELVQHAADLRSNANRMLEDQTNLLEWEIGGGPVEWECNAPQAFSVRSIMFSSKADRFDAFHHVGYVREAIDKAVVPLVEVHNFAKALYPPYMKRIRIDEGGVEFLGGSDMMTLDQRGTSTISLKTPKIDQFIIRNGYVLFQCDGQRYGIFGRPILANRSLIGKAVSQHAMRLIPYDPLDSGYLSVFLATGFGRRLSMRFSAGSSIPSLNEEGARKILVYWPSKNRRHEISRIAEQAWENRALATDLEDQARTLVENAIEAGGRSWRR